MPPPGDILRPEQEQAIIALLREPSAELAAKAVGVDVSTVYRWRSSSRPRASDC